MAFIRESALSFSQNAIYVVPLSSDFRVAGRPVRFPLTHRGLLLESHGCQRIAV